VYLRDYERLGAGDSLIGERVHGLPVSRLQIFQARV
jgi:hypothetical protein